MDQPTLSRIAVESQSDWLRVQENIKRGLEQAMEARLGALPGGKDGEAAKRVRKEVEGRLEKIREEMFRLSVPNLRVNGHNYEDFVDATEPFDEMLDRKIKGLDTERVAWGMSVAARRKRTPADIYRLEANLEERREMAEWLPEGEDDEGEQQKRAVDIPKPPRHQETIETFGEVVSNLSQLASMAPKQLARAQRAQSVREEIASIPP
ncbi:hypothetical protein BCR39DRAFT_519931 [Naematelia encephala]|uniref:Kinetochore protein Mis14 like-domain-containing protein n=1 Tax=Naematelia encephala TaxID=71784 RepID=A0A1Y2BF21_9TREE|nr:hypothetical protein BCR39DRAFT_519931 [Naematelia encephala]